MTYRYFYKELQWKFRNTDGSWDIKNPPLPRYAEEFSPVHFVRIWARCHSMNDVHRLLFWLSKEEIENYVEEINAALQNCGYEPLKTLQYQEQGIFSDEDFLSLEDEGYIQKKNSLYDNVDSSSKKDTEEKTPENLRTTEDEDQEETSSTTALYNQMQKKGGAYDPLRHVFTTELGKFSVRH